MCDKRWLWSLRSHLQYLHLEVQILLVGPVGHHNLALFLFYAVLRQAETAPRLAAAVKDVVIL